MVQRFSASVEKWVAKSETLLKAVFQESVQAAVSEMQTTRNEGGRMPVSTGFLRASLMASTSAMPAVRKGNAPPPGTPENSIPYAGEVVELVIANAEPTDTIYLGYTAEYAGHQEFGASGMPPAAFVRSTAQRWPQIVAQVVNELKNRTR